MKRAAVAIAVKNTKSPQLRELQATTAGAQRFADWATKQGFDLVKVLTDEAGPLTISEVKKVFVELEAQGVEQLFIYFAGHGMNNHGHEVWLLSGAPLDDGEAINVTRSLRFAKRWVVPHVVFVSDACRTAAHGIVEQDVEGSSLLPNRAPGGPVRSADIFYATLLGDPSLEVPDADQHYHAVFTDLLVDGLSFRVPQCIEAHGQQPFSVIRQWKLHDYLYVAVPQRLFEITKSYQHSQVPDSVITARATTWLARRDQPPPDAETPPTPDFDPGPLPTLKLTNFSQDKRFAAFRSDEMFKAPPGPAKESAMDRLKEQLKAEIAVRRESFGSDWMGTHCGVKVRGAKLEACGHPAVDVIMPDRRQAMVHTKGFTTLQAPLNLLLTFSHGTGLVLPAFPGFIASLTFERENLIEVAYEPAADDSPQWLEFQTEQARLREFRALLGAVVRHGAYPLLRATGLTAELIWKAMRYGETGIDVTAALYAAYVWERGGGDGPLTDLQGVVQQNFGIRLFDHAMLTETLQQGRPFFPATPLLAQGWGLLRASGLTLPPWIAELSNHLTPSFWSQYDAEGVHILQDALAAGAL